LEAVFSVSVIMEKSVLSGKNISFVNLKENGMKGNIGAISAPRQRAAGMAVLRILVSMTLVALAFVSCSKKGAEAGKQAEVAVDRIRLGVMTDSITDYVGIIGNSEGVFAKYGLRVESTSFAAGINTIDAVTLGQLDIGGGADFAVLNRLGGSQDTPLRIFAGLGDVVNSSRLYTRDASVNSPADLAGKAVVVQLGTVNEYYHAKTLAAVGVSPSSVKFLPVEGVMEGVALIQNGSAQAMWANARAAEALDAIAGVRPIARLDTYVSSTVHVGIATEQYLKANQRAVEKYLQATEEIYQFIRDDPRRAAGIINKSNATPVEQILLNLETWENYVEFDQKFYDTLDSLYRWAEGSGVIKYPYEPRRYINTDALRAAFPGRGSFN
jgi:NitT/TauT family transport system substrate-binding protein